MNTMIRITKCTLFQVTKMDCPEFVQHAKMLHNWMWYSTIAEQPGYIDIYDWFIWTMQYMLTIRGPCSMSHVYMEHNCDVFQV